ncbi:Uncharacterised protein [Neisseria gonorrhoeae]|nr:Uncharacterised protein [Neisseria gonorrhoeae]CFH22115.1 Uncharacterised protein [Neisseria gonorrhoeae]CNP20207.1 Uncharacterised protein [Neisseria gonorrhoeae]CNP20506.1 Uncharacterised protein [Neisseria gonorrhoeae]CNP30185.1 Uncharacterised protein [Neisseria gonorrhoeae]
MFLPVLVICNAAQDKAAVHAVAVAHIAFFGKGAQLFGEGGVLVFNILTLHRTGDVAELQFVAAFIRAGFFEDMHHPVVGRSCQIPADRRYRAVDDVAQIAGFVIVIFFCADAVFLAVLFFVALFFVVWLVECFKYIVITVIPSRPRQQHFAPLVGLRCDEPVLVDAESVVFAVIAIKTRDPAAVLDRVDLVHAARQSDHGLP